MTATEQTPLVCPKCSGTNTAIGGSGSAICTDCAHLWNPADPVIPPTPTPQPFGLAPVHEVFGPDAYTGRDVEAFDPADAVGGIATLEGGQTAEVVSFTPYDHLIVRLSTGDLERVPIGDVLRIMPPVVIPEPVAIPANENELAPDLQLAISLARVIIRAGCESVNGTGEQITPGVPPTGYLPADTELHEVVERAAGLAVGMLLEVLEADIDAVLTWVGAVDDHTEVATETTEDASDTSTGNNE